MASDSAEGTVSPNANDHPAAVENASAAPIPAQQIQTQTDTLPSSTPVEMSNLQHREAAQTSAAADEQPHAQAANAGVEASHPKDAKSNSPEINAQRTAPRPEQPVEDQETQLPPPAQPVDAAASKSNAPSKDPSAIGPAAETGMPSNVTDGSAVPITLLLTTGARHPFTITVKYLQKRNVAGAHADDFDPFDITVWALKDLIWQDWRSDWEPRPTAPNSIRLIHFGKLLDDSMRLRECKFISTTSNVVHMTIKPQELVDEEENAKKGSRRDDMDGDRGSGCRCCVIL